MSEGPSPARRGLDRLLAALPNAELESFDSQLPHPIEVYELDEHGNRTSNRPYRVWELPAGPWVVVTFVGGDEYAIWKPTGHVYRVGRDHAVEEEPVYTP